MAFSGSESEYELEEILESRKRGRATEYKVRWRGFGEEEDSWEPERSLMKSAPEAVEKFKKKGAAVAQKKTTPTRAVKQLKEENSLPVTPKGSGRSSRNSTTTTTTTTTLVTKLESFSDASDNEGGLVRRSTRSVTKTSSSSSGAKAAAPTKPSLLARCKNCLCCVSCANVRQELPFLIYLACMGLILATFVYEKL